jgi:spore coat protein CotH
MLKKSIVAIAAFSFLLASKSISQTFYDLNTIQRIEISFSQPDWDYQMDTAKSGSEGYTMAQWVKINGQQFDSVGVKYKGNSSYNPSYGKNPFHIALDEFKDQSYQGYEDIKLGNGYSDPSMIREVLSYDILQNYMDCPKANFAQLFVNGNYIGLYSNAESIGKSFCSDHFYSSGNTFFKCNPTVTPSPVVKSNLKYIPAVDSTGYFNYYELKSDHGWNEMVALCDTVTNYPTSISSILDMDRVIWMLAFNNVLVNLDSYNGVFAQNYYLYKDNTAHFNPVIWDLNMSFGGFPYVGSGTSSMGSLTVTNMQQLTPLIHSTDANWPLIKDVLNNPMFKRMYIAHMRTITNEIFVSNAYVTTATQLQNIVDTAVVADSNSFFSYAQFQTAMTTNNVVGSYTVPGISNLMNARISYLQSTTDFTYLPPSISAISSSSLFPSLDSSVTITAKVVNANAVYLGFRHDVEDKFSRVLMYDDGMHNDGVSGDSIYGAAFLMLSSQVQYYIYSENSNAGMFSPERAEHEFYTLLANAQNPTAGQVVINEFLAQNQNYNTNEYGQHQDWIELFNTTSSPKNLFGVYLTDNFSNLNKYSFPPNTIIPAGGYLIVWADQDSSTTSYLHCNFKLGASGEQIMLSNSAGMIIDSVTYGAQTADLSTGRCLNGTGSFTVLAAPSFNSMNCATGIDEADKKEKIKIYPNPACSFINIEFDDKNKINVVSIYNSLGQQIVVNQFGQERATIDISGFNDGIYLVKINNDLCKRLEVLH